MNNKESSVNVKRFENGGMVEVHHFTGSLLLSRYEANHLRTLLDIELSDTSQMTHKEALRVVREREEMLSQHFAETA